MRSLVLALFSSLFLLPAVAQDAPAQKRVVLQAGELIDGTGKVLYDQQVVVEGGHIVSVGPAGRARMKADYDLGGMTLMPGWIDTHVHLQWHMNADHKAVPDGPAEEMVLYDEVDSWLTLEDGFTTVESVGSNV